MSKIITNDYGERYQTPGFWKTAGAIVVGNTAYGLVNNAKIPVSRYCLNTMKSLSQSCDTVTLKSAVGKAFASAELASKGVKLKNVNENSVIINRIYDNLPDFIKKLVSPFDAAKRGNNAFYLPKDKMIIVNLDKLGMSTFHEMGHAVNHNCSKFWKYVQKSRQPLLALAGIMSTIALFKRPKADGEQPKNSFDKATTFIKNNVGKLVTLSFVPIVAEELMASHRGNKMAEKVLSKEMLAKVKKFNKLGAITYIATGLTMGLGAFVATKVRDEIAHPKEV